MRRPLPVIENCDGCGACCTEQAALPVHLVGTYFRLEPVAPLPPQLAVSLLQTVERFENEGWPNDGTPCIWYDEESRRCKHYDYRPTLCRDEVVPGDESCMNWRRHGGID